MNSSSVLIANRGETSIRISRAASDLGLRTVAVHTEDDRASLHTPLAGHAEVLAGVGAAAYLDIDAVIAAAQRAGCDAIHPEYGFLAERADFAKRCIVAGLTLIGPKPEHLALFGDKTAARAAAASAGVPIIRGTDRTVSLAEAKAFFAGLGSGGP